MTRIIKRLVVIAAVALAAVGISIATAAASNASDRSTGAVSTENEHDWS